MQESLREQTNDQIAREYYHRLSSDAERHLRWSQYFPPALTCKEGYRLGRPRLVLWDNAQGLCDYDPWSLTVLERFDHDAKLMVRSAVWHSRQDFRVVGDFMEGERDTLPILPSPTIQVRDCRIDRADWEEIMHEFYRLRFPLFWSWDKSESPHCTDCPSRGILYFDKPDPQGRVEFSWGYLLPPGYEAIPGFFICMTNWLNARLEAAGPQS